MSVTAGDATALFDRWQLAQHNDDAHGYWISIDNGVYDVSDFLRTHPGGARILQLYAGRDASHGFARVHSSLRHVALLLERCRIGTLRSASCVARPDHAPHHAAYRALDATLALVVEMQNALTADHSFQLEPRGPPGASARPSRRSRYELQRAVETHARFHREYLDVLVSDNWVQLASSLVQVDFEAHAQLERLMRSPECVSARAQVLELLEQLERFADDQLAVTVACFEVSDSWLLGAWKRELSRALRSLERPHVASLNLGDTPSLHALCGRLLEHLRVYFGSAVPMRASD